jgi:hypothetical protein
MSFAEMPDLGNASGYITYEQHAQAMDVLFSVLPAIVTRQYCWHIDEREIESVLWASFAICHD